jgi:hypothetical protein
MNIEDKLQLLDIQEVTTDRQKSNGTREFELPIKDSWSGKKIRVASFKTGYVRNQNSCHSAYQLNKRYFEDEYFKDYDWVDGEQKWNGKYRKYKNKKCKLILNEQDRLEYLISYCLKNYYIGYANQVADGEFIPRWRYEDDIKNAIVENTTPEVKVIVNGHRYNII